MAAGFGERLLAALGPVDLDGESLGFAVELARLAVRALGLTDPEEAERAALVGALRARTGLDEERGRRLLDLALAPEHRGAPSPRELRAYAARFGEEAARRLRDEFAGEPDLALFARRHGSDGALLLLDSLFAVAAADGHIDDAELARIEGAAAELGVDPVLVTALLNRHEPSRARAEMRFPLDRDEIVVGRAPDCHVVLHDPQVARHHARIVRGPAGWRVVDMGSGRPTVVGGAAVRSAPLVEGVAVRVGPYVLRRVGEELHVDGTRRFSSLSVRGLSRRVGDLAILQDVRFTAFSGEVIAVVGPSGCGKTTLLNAVSGVAPPDAGEVRLDGADFAALLELDPSLVGIVPQDDLVLPELTVEESLRFSGRLRLPPDVARSELDEAVDRVLAELGIEEIRDRRIGDALRRGISGGQRKRVNLGQELITRTTRVLFLDEPTSGLDPRASRDIARLVRQVADRGRIVFLVTHDLIPEVMVQVDHLLVLVPGGRVACFAPPAEACRYFGVSTPDAIFARLEDRSPEEWARAWRDSPEFRKYVATREHLVGMKRGGDGASPARPRGRRTVRLAQLATLTARYARVKLRDRTGMAVLAAQPPLLALVMAVVFPEPSSPMLFMLSLASLWFGMSAAVRELISDRVVWNRERKVGVGVLPYVGSKVVVLGVLVALQALALAGILYFTHDLGEYGFRAPVLFGVTALVGLVGMSLGLLVSASWSSSEAAVGTLPLLLIPQITLSSIMVSLKDMTPLARFLSRLAVERYAFDAVIKSGTHYAMANPYLKGEWRREPNVRLLFELGLKPTSDADDLGLPLVELVGVLGVFFVAFLAAAALLVHLRGRAPRRRRVAVAAAPE